MQVSVIIPVYNAAAYLREAVESALAQAETAEVILAEDGSTDGSLAVCQDLAAADERVRLVRHPDGGNHGAGATRNLAIWASTCPFIAFLDADDFYLPGRFTVARQLLETDATLDGVYEAIGAHFESETARQQAEAAGIGVSGDGLTTLTERVPPEDLFRALVQGGRGNFHGDGLVIRRAVLDKSGLFDAHLRLHQDTALWIKLAAVGRLVAGRLDEPVAVRRLHASNRITDPRAVARRQRTQAVMWTALWRWSRAHLPPAQQHILLDALIKHTVRPDHQRPAWIGRPLALARLAALPLQVPALFGSVTYWRRYLARALGYMGLGRLVRAGRGEERP